MNTVLKNEYEDLGYSILKGAIPLDILGNIREALRLALVNGDADYANLSLDELVMLREKQDHNLVYEAAVSVGSSLPAISLLNTQMITEACEACFGSLFHSIHPMPLHIAIQIPNNDSFDYKWHQESAFYDWCPDILNIWFPIVRPSSRKEGTMSVIPKSHSQGQVSFKNYKNDAGFTQLESQLDVSDESEIDKLYMELELGDFVIFHPDLVHKSEANLSSLPRYSGILRIVDMSTQPKYHALYKAWSGY